MKTINKSMLILGILTFVLQSCTHDVYVDPQAAEKAAYENADAVNGAKLFSNFQNVEAGWPADATGWPDVTYAADITINIKDIATNSSVPTAQKNLNFYSCAGCHAVDGMGRNEAGVNKKVSATQPDIAASHLRDTRGWDNVKLFDAIKNVGGRAIDPTKTINGLDPSLGGQTHPDFSKILTDDKIWDLVKWLKEGVDNRNGDLYDVAVTGTYAIGQTAPTSYQTYSNWGTGGDAAAGVAFYTAKCVVCHGADGHGTLTAQGPVLQPGQVNGTIGAGAGLAQPGSVRWYGIGSYMRTRTPESVFLIQTGKFGTIPWMAATPITQEQMRDLLAAFADTNRFPNFTTKLVNP